MTKTETSSFDVGRWRRRAKTIPAMLGLTTVGIVVSPVLLPAAAANDLARGRRRLPTVRTLLFVLQYGINDSAEILAAPLLWARAGFGARIDDEGSLRRHEAIQRWSAELLARRAEQLLGLRIVTDVDPGDVLRPAPVIVVSRHVSVLDGALPGLVAHRAGLRPKAVIMAELLADPGFDLIYTRLGSVFIDRDDGPRAREAVSAMVTDQRHTEPGDTEPDDSGPEPSPPSAYLIFPEGRLFRRSVRDRAIDRLTRSDPVRGERLAGLERSLPPRPGGLRALLQALPETDVVVVEARGMEELAHLTDLRRLAPLNEPIELTMFRIPRDEIPSAGDSRPERDRFVRWLDELWLDLDRRAGARDAARACGIFER